MSEFCGGKVIKIDNMTKHPEADNLSLIDVDGYNVIVRTADFNLNDLAIHISQDAIVPLDNPKFSFLKKPRIGAMRLRGIFSTGLLVKADSDMFEGQDVQELLGITKYEEPEYNSSGNNKSIFTTKAPKGPQPSWAPSDYDLDGLRKYKRMLTEGEEVVILEKLDGQNFRACMMKDQLWVGSHHRWILPGNNDVWWQNAIKYDLENKLKQYEGKLIFGECIGQNRKMHYGLYKDEIDMLVFDVYDVVERRFMDYDVVLALCSELGLRAVPELYRGPWNTDLIALAEGPSMLTDKHIREGFVVKPTIEKMQHGHRVILKYPSETYLINKHK